MIEFTESDIRRSMTAQSFQRGQAYYRQGRVSGLKTEMLGNGIELVMARVRGSGRNVYSVNISLLRGPTIDSECSCPIGSHCKHTAAVLLNVLAARGKSAGSNKLPEELQNMQALIQRMERERGLGAETPAKALIKAARAEESVDPVLENWLRRLESAAQEKPENPNQPSYHVLYLLGIEQRQSKAEIKINVVSTRLLKTGGYGKPTPVRSRTAAYMQENDHSIMRWLDTLRDMRVYSYHDNSYRFRQNAELGSVLELILKSGRCRWLHKDGPLLSMGAVRAARLEWALQSDGRQRPEYAIEGGGEVLPLSPPWYIDLHTHTCGMLHTTLKNEVAAAFLEAPALDPEQAEKVRQRLARLDSLPQPHALKKKRLEKCTPVPHLYLYSEEIPLTYYGSMLHDVDSAVLSLAKLSFVYKDKSVEAWPDADASIMQYDPAAQELVEIPRHKAGERKAREHLKNYGFHHLYRHPFYQHFSAVPEEARYHLFPLVEQSSAGPAVQNFLTRFSLVEIPRLRAAGWRVEMAEDYLFRVVEQEFLEDWYAEIDESTGIDWFGLELGIHVNKERVNLLPLLVEMLRGISSTDALAELMDLPDDALLTPRLEDGRILPLPIKRVRDILRVLVELLEKEPLDEEGRLRLQSLRAAQLAELEAAMQAVEMRWFGGDALLALGRKLKNFQGVQTVDIPVGFKTELRPYQHEGLNWLQFLREYNMGGVLADDMGLGKTVQTLAHILLEKQHGRMDKPSLVIAPTSLMVNWRMEAARFTPSLRVLVLHGPERREHFEKIAECDLVLTTYPLLSRDKEALLEHDYHLLVLDEAQNIKNPKTKATQIVHQITARHRLCLTGTPMENHLGELWSLYHFLMPGLLGDNQSFRQLFRNPIEKDHDPTRRDILAKRIKPFLLRRTKQQVVQELPEKTEILRSVELDGGQRDLYETIRLTMHDKVRREIAQKGMARSQIIILDALLKLRQICCDPRLLKLDAAKQVKNSAKLDLLMDVLPEMLEEGRRVLLFSQFTSMLRLIESELHKRAVDYVKLTGQTRKRAEAVERFQNGEVPLFLISLKAGGTGLNLTAADTVIHYDPWWNPAVENQATDRAHRIGQDKKVFVYKLLTTGTVEEKIQELQERKRHMADALLSGKDGAGAHLSHADLDALFEPLG